MTDRPTPDEPSVTVTEDEQGTEALGEQLAGTLRAGDVVLLSGPLGAGKTAFVRGMARGLGLGAAEVSSPTFTLIHEYRGGRLTLFHVDLYRLYVGWRGRSGLAGTGCGRRRHRDRVARAPDAHRDRQRDGEAGTNGRRAGELAPRHDHAAFGR